ncbi:MAG TPA: carbohydrate-binding family V/XII [Blastocatellia bacterium]|nr:carbohydrate-binding family V/XII [Blastocatellia bacterium]
MKSISAKLILALVAIFVCVAASQTSSAQTAPTDKGWPRKFVSPAGTFSVYQPQIEQWRGNRFEARAAVAIADGQSKQTTYGVLWFTSRTEIDKVNRLVRMTDFRITKVSFPTAAERAAHYRDLLQQQAPNAGDVIALDRLLAEMAITEAGDENTRYQLKNDAPRIFFSTRTAILILIDGSPVLRPVKGTELKRVINTRVLILHDESKGMFYLHLMDGWMESLTATGPWVIAQKTPDDLEKALKIAAESKQVDLLDGAGAGSGQTQPSLKQVARTGLIPSIYTSTEPAELIQTMGDPQVASIEGTRLIYVTNTENDIFVDVSTQTHYVLISGRWFRSETMNGPWSYVAGGSLPADFARIPATHAKADVLVSVPGTPQAKEAMIANSIPQTATITRSAASLTISYDGPPQFKPIESTSLQYAVNTATPVIAVSAASYYAVKNGVWFVAGSPAGPWAVASSVPAIIYTIPPSSPLHHVTYVKVYGATPEVVYVGYTPGYYGTVVSSDNVVVYGTGWYFPPYIGGYWYGWGWTYGYAAGFAWSTYAGWGVAFGVGYGWSSYYYPGAWYAAAGWGYYPAAWGGVAAANVYGQWGNVAYSGARAAWANPYTGNVGYGSAYSGVNIATGTRYNGRGFTNTNVYTGTTVSGVGGVAYNPNTGRVAAGQAGAVSNAYTGNGAAGARGVHYNPQTGVISGGAVGATYNADTGKVTAGGRGFAYNTNTDTGVVVGKNNVYAGRDGEVYRYNKSSGLEQHTSDGWSSVRRPSDNQSFHNQQSARAAGQQRWENFRSGSRSGGAQRSSGMRFGRRR